MRPDDRGRKFSLGAWFAMLAAICVLMGMSDGWKAAGQFVRETGGDWKRWF